MSKEIKISIKNIEKLQFSLEESAENGDYICLNSILSNNTKIIKDFNSALNSRISQEIKHQAITEKNLIIGNYKNSAEYKNLKKCQTENEFLDSVKYKEQIINEFKADDNSDYGLLRKNNTILNQEKVYVIMDFKAQPEYIKLKSNEKNYARLVSDEYKKTNKEVIINQFMLAETGAYKKLEEENQCHKNEITKLESFTKLKSSNIIGTELQNHILEELEKSFSMDDICHFNSEQKIDNGRCDFLFTIGSSENPTKIVIELKTKNQKESKKMKKLLNNWKNINKMRKLNMQF